nr:MAG TPA: hypothetical protein [Caudoviricetes sp.]
MISICSLLINKAKVMIDLTLHKTTCQIKFRSAQ